MKHFKIFVSLMLVCMMMLAIVSGTVSAEDESSAPVVETGTITINNVQSGATYTVYEILSLLSYDAEKEAYKYHAQGAWVNFFKNNSAAKKIFELVVDEEDLPKVVALKDNLTDPIPADDIQDFAKAALDYAQDNGIQPAKEPQTAPVGAETVVFEGLELGYYLVQSSIGTILSLNAANPDAVMYDKNPATTLTKTVNDNNVNIGDKVRFTITVKLEDNIDTTGLNFADPSKQGCIKDLVIHDIMDDSFSLINNSFTFSARRPTGSNTTSTIPINGKYSVLLGDETGDDCTFGIKFDDDLFRIGDVITINYDATLNEKAVIGEPGNKNKSFATYGGHTTPESEVTVYTAKIIIDKYAKDDETAKLSGATFVLKNKDGDYYQADYDEDGKVKKVNWVTQQDDATHFVTDDNGFTEIIGVEAGKYALVETAAPDGFNRILEDITVNFETAKDENDKEYFVSYETTEQIANAKGALLPATGGIGTTLFIVFGSISAIAAGVILVARRRMKLIGTDI